MNLKQAQSKLNSMENKSREIADYFLFNYNNRNDKYRLLVAINPHLDKDIDYMDYERKKGYMRSHLHGMPFIVSDLISTKGLPTTMGIKVLENNVEENSADFIKVLKKNGLVFFGKSNTNEIQQVLDLKDDDTLFLSPVNPFGDELLNGLALSIASDLAPIGFDIDINGNFIYSCSKLNLVGLKLTNNLVPKKGLFLPTASSGLAIVGHNTLDLAFVMDLIVSEKRKVNIYGKHSHKYIMDTLAFPNSFRVGTTIQDHQFLKEIGYNINEINPRFTNLEMTIDAKGIHDSLENKESIKTVYSLNKYMEDFKFDVIIFDQFSDELKSLENPVLSINVSYLGKSKELYLVSKTFNEDKLLTCAEIIEEAYKSSELYIED